jgi:hypothetical protein
LNAECAAEEARGLVRWLRLEFQDPSRHDASLGRTPMQDEMDLGDTPTTALPKPTPSSTKGRKPATTAAAARRTWPNTPPEQMRTVAALLTAAGRPITLAAIEAEFSGRGPWKRGIPQILDALAALGRVRLVNRLCALGERRLRSPDSFSEPCSTVRPCAFASRRPWPSSAR